MKEKDGHELDITLHTNETYIRYTYSYRNDENDFSRYSHYLLFFSSLSHLRLTLVLHCTPRVRGPEAPRSSKCHSSNTCTNTWFAVYASTNERTYVFHRAPKDQSK